MKVKHGFIITLAASAVLIVLRILQLLFAIDSAGYFRDDTVLARVLSPSLYILLIVLALVLLPVLFKKPAEYIRFLDIYRGRVPAAMLIIIALMLAFYSGMRLGGALSDMRFDIAAPFGLLSAVFFIAAAFWAAGARHRYGLFAVSGLMAPVFMALYIITLFFDSFKQIKISENKLDILTVCALALVFITLSLLAVGAGSVTRRRFGYILMMYMLFASVSSISRIILWVFGAYSFGGVLQATWAWVELVVFVFSAYTLKRLAFDKKDMPYESGQH